jgi:hypothetical protein
MIKGFVKRECSEELSATECNNLRAQGIEMSRIQTQESIKRLDEACKKSVLLEDECVEKKREFLKALVSKGERDGLIEKQPLNR